MKLHIRLRASKPARSDASQYNKALPSVAFKRFQKISPAPTRTLIPSSLIPSPRTPGREGISTLTSDLGAGAKSGPKQRFGGFLAARRLPATATAVGVVK